MSNTEASIINRIIDSRAMEAYGTALPLDIMRIVAEYEPLPLAMARHFILSEEHEGGGACVGCSSIMSMKKDLPNTTLEYLFTLHIAKKHRPLLVDIKYYLDNVFRIGSESRKKYAFAILDAHFAVHGGMLSPSLMSNIRKITRYMRPHMTDKTLHIFMAFIFFPQSVVTCLDMYKAKNTKVLSAAEVRATMPTYVAKSLSIEQQKGFMRSRLRFEDKKYILVVVPHVKTGKLVACDLTVFADKLGEFRGIDYSDRFIEEMFSAAEEPPTVLLLPPVRQTVKARRQRVAVVAAHSESEDESGS